MTLMERLRQVLHEALNLGPPPDPPPEVAEGLREGRDIVRIIEGQHRKVIEQLPPELRRRVDARMADIDAEIEVMQRRDGDGE